MTITVANSSAIVALDALVDPLDVGSTNAEARVKIYAGTAPARVDASIGSPTLLSTHLMTIPGSGGAFGGSVDVSGSNLARATANAIANATAVAGGTPTFFRVEDRNEVAKIQGSVSLSGGGGDLIINASPIVIGATVEVSSLTIDLPEGA